MKKIYALLFVTLLGLSFYACKKDTPAEPTNKITGEWKINNRVFEFYAGGKLIDTQTENNSGNNTEYVILNEDGTGSFKKNGETNVKFAYTVSDATISFTHVTSFYNNQWYDGSDFKYTNLKLGTAELYYSTEGPVSSPAPYDKYVTRVHLIK
ncbi:MULTISPECIES: hypothetical protein [unclassified Mucilaginibacter]|uniref:hypothetical protein n=1 Tax=unclassified Mucilaginibacter TaxID=2617802 RepID=UPI002AC8B289|nr:MULTISPECIES: hypothetical protein [unclassified Mucilaginibacter]MEB0262652.1 hypothetical protein [Mucilaginibacter sp. 10I4]MEB0280604.1 hypothetical protein [Mucilaginibacter sp. 10B2]MEB0300802.1 hypothetical protein [Mucilaginibacter sp. 5C4]WPX24978.1 hypothetical protein RHM67_06845 [Mucilaginibacter sp. 5C4]